jgi:hypothetical protein
MHLPSTLRLVAALAVLAIPVAATDAQPPADATERLRAALPADVAERVLSRIAQARERALPAQALENRALKYASRGIDPVAIERAIGAHADRMLTVKGLLQGVRPQSPEADEVDAGAEALRQGVDGPTLSALAKSAPSGRSLAVPLFVLGGLVERGVPADSALARVRGRLEARASDTDLETLANGRSANAGNHGNGGLTGLERAASMRPAGAGGAGGAAGASGSMPGVPQNGGKKVTPTKPNPPRPPRPDRP